MRSSLPTQLNQCRDVRSLMKDGFELHKRLIAEDKLRVTVPSEMLESWNIVSKA